MKRALQSPEVTVTNINNDSDEGASVCFIGVLQLAERFERYTIKPSFQIVRPYLIFTTGIASREAIKEATKAVIDHM